MDRLSQLRGDAGGSGDSTLDSTSPPSESYMTANESSSKYFSLSDSTFDITPIKDVSLASASSATDRTTTDTDELISNLSPIGKKDMLDTYKIGKQIEAANILSGGVDIFDDNDNSFDGDELVIDDNVDLDDKSNPGKSEVGVEDVSEPTLVEAGDADVASKDMEVVLQIDGKNVNAIDIGNGLYLYRKDGEEELAAVQIIDGDQPQPSFKFLKVRENAEGNLEVYEEIEIEVPKEVPTKEGKPVDKNTPHVPIIDINKVTSDSPSNKVTDRTHKSPQKETTPSTSTSEKNSVEKETSPETKTEVNLNGKMVKFNESRKSPVVGSFTPMTFHSTPNKEGKPLTKTMVDQQLHPNRHSDNVKKTIEVHTDTIKQKTIESPSKGKDSPENVKSIDTICNEKEKLTEPIKQAILNPEIKEADKIIIPEKIDKETLSVEDKSANDKSSESAEKPSSTDINTEQNENVVAETNLSKNELIDANCDKQIVAKLPKPEIISDFVEDSIAGELVIDEGADKVIDEEVKKIDNKDDTYNEKQSDVDNEKIGTGLLPTNTKDKTDDKTVDSEIETVDSEIETHVSKIETVVSEIEKEEDTKVENVESPAIHPVTNKDQNSKDEKLVKDNPEPVELEVHNDTMQNTGKLQEIETNASSSAICTTRTDKINENMKSELKTVDNSALKMPLGEANKSFSSKPTERSSTTKVLTKSDEVEKVIVESIPEVSSTTTISGTKESKVESITIPEPVIFESVTSITNANESEENKTDKDSLSTKKLSGIENKTVATSSTLNKDNNTDQLKAKESTSTEINKATRVEAADKIEVSAKIPKKAIIHTKSVDTTNIKDKSKTTIVNSDTKSGVSKITSIPLPEKKPITATAPPTSKENINKEKTPSEVTLNEIKEIKPSGQSSKIVEMNSANKICSKNVDTKTAPKIEETKKINDKIANQNEAIPKNRDTEKNVNQIKTDPKDVKEPVNKPNPEEKPVNNNHTAAVPFGKWTEANTQEFLNKFKEVKVPVNTNSKQIKNSNDLNRRDVLKKIDSQRQQTIINNATSKAQQEKIIVKTETVFSNKTAPPKIETKIPLKTVSVEAKAKQTSNKITTKQGQVQKAVVSSSVAPSTATVASVTKIDTTQRKDLSTATMASLIDKTIEDMINRVVPGKNVADEPKPTKKISVSESESTAQVTVARKQIVTPVVQDPETLDDIEMKMNELHGIPFVERPPHELPKVPNTDVKTISKVEKDKPLSTGTKITENISTNEQKNNIDNVIDIESEDEIIDHEPITGDMELIKKPIPKLPTVQEKPSLVIIKPPVHSKEASNKESIITETDFDKFAGKNSVTYENCITVKFDKKEPLNVVQTIKEKNFPAKVYPKTEIIRIEPKAKLPQKPNMRHNVHVNKAQNIAKFGAVPKDSSNKKYQSKIHSAYQSALTAKHEVTHPITIIEDKPVKVVFVESGTGFVPSQLNVQGQELSPAKKSAPDLETAATSNTLYVDTDIPEICDENKQQDKTKTKHQRKQVLTPVEAPELELIRPSDIGLEASPKKRRKLEENKGDKQSRNLVHKKSYLLGRNNTDDKLVNSKSLPKETSKETLDRGEDVPERKDAASAIDNLVKAAELLENQSDSINKSNLSNSDSQQNTPVKRGRGRPRKYPLPEGASENKQPSSQKKLKLIDAKPVKRDSISDDQEYDSSEEGIVRENWTMGKINENIVCPICNKLFRSENVVFKHVKHCTGVSPNRSDSDKRSPRRGRLSQESEDMEMYDERSVDENKKKSPKKRKSKESIQSETKSEEDKEEAIENNPVREKLEKSDKEKDEDTKKAKSKLPLRTNSLVCEFCGKTFRQLSYLVSHKLQHKKEQAKKAGQKDVQDSNKLQVFSCDICKKEFRKLHHLVQHRIIHNPETAPTRTLRKSSSDQHDAKQVKEESIPKQSEDPSAAFRCEPCDKSFRKLHHLVEHRETHDGINRQKTNAPVQPSVEKPPPPPQCDICKKTFRKLHHLIDHKEQHADTSSEKSDDKSVKSSLSTRDIIHECSLCYMVFPNEHSLNKHSVNCARKKRQSKQLKDVTETESVTDGETPNSEDKKDTVLEINISDNVAHEIVDDDDDDMIVVEPDDENVKSPPKIEKEVEILNVTEEKDKSGCTKIVENSSQKEKDIKVAESHIIAVKRDLTKTEDKKIKEDSVIPEKIKKVEDKEIKIVKTPKKKNPVKDKATAAVTKHQKTIDEPVPIVADVKTSVESSDDDEVRYMFNPNCKIDEIDEAKIFMNVRAHKRNSLQIERPSSKDFVKRRTSLQHPPKIVRLKPKVTEPKSKEPKLKPTEPKRKSVEQKSKAETKTASSHNALKHIQEIPEREAALSTDSDDSDVKYSFPKATPELSKPVQKRTPKDSGKKVPRKSIVEKRKSLSGIAKRKSLGKAISTKHKVNASPVNPVKKRTREAEHRCDCGQLFSSAALLARHTSLAHTPPRIRRRRSPPPALSDKTKPKHINKSPADTDAPAASSKPTRKSSVKSETTDARKSTKLDASATKTPAKTRRSAAHIGVPVPEKMRKMMQKIKK